MTCAVSILDLQALLAHLVLKGLVENLAGLDKTVSLEGQECLDCREKEVSFIPHMRSKSSSSELLDITSKPVSDLLDFSALGQ